MPGFDFSVLAQLPAFRQWRRVSEQPQQNLNPWPLLEPWQGNLAPEAIIRRRPVDIPGGSDEEVIDARRMMEELHGLQEGYRQRREDI